MSEKQIITEFLLLYKEFPCLWDNRQVLYTNKEAKDQAWEVLLEKYRQIQEDANLIDVKKKIENMRAAFRRERKKVLISQMNDDGEEHTPKLWYYDLMVFLDEIGTYNLEPLSKQSDSSKEHLKVEYEELETSSPPPKIRPKKRKTNVSAVYLPESRESEDDEGHIDDDAQTDMLYDEYTMTHGAKRIKSTKETATEAFGTAIGLQLKDLEPMQRTIAEKLISEVIFNARLNSLTVNSSIKN